VPHRPGEGKAVLRYGDEAAPERLAPNGGGVEPVDGEGAGCGVEEPEEGEEEA